VLRRTASGVGLSAHLTLTEAGYKEANVSGEPRGRLQDSIWVDPRYVLDDTGRTLVVPPSGLSLPAGSTLDL